MIDRFKAVMLGSCLLGTMVCAHSAHAALPYSGVYVVIDPYNQINDVMLHQASVTSCPVKQQATPPSPFCGAVDGILLRIGWCNFEPDHATNGMKWSSCHYTLGYSNGAGSAAKQVPLSPTTEYTTPCTLNYDVCANTTQSTLGTALGYITRINAMRAASHYLPPLKLSIGLAAGMWTPESVFNTAGYVDVQHNDEASGNPASRVCMRLPQPWAPSFATDYGNAIDQLLSFVISQMPQGANIQILKASGIVSNDLEVSMPGMPKAISVPGPDPLKPISGMGPALNCSSTVSSAQTWLSAYDRAPVGSQSFAQSVEAAFGAIVGHEYASLNNRSVNAIISIPSTGGEAFTYVNCGVSGTTSCSISASSGNWSLYYLTKYVDDLFTGGTSAKAADAAYVAVRPSSRFAMPADALSVNWTALSPTPIVPSSQISCIMNNTVRANDSALVLDGLTQELNGIGTTIAWQTHTQMGGTCSAAAHNTYMTALNNGVNEGAKFLEVETDAAITNNATCGTDLAAASRALDASLLNSCHY